MTYDPFGTKYANKVATRYHDRTISLGEKGGDWGDLLVIHNNTTGENEIAWIDRKIAKELATLLLEQYDLVDKFVDEHTAPQPERPEFDIVRHDLSNNPWRDRAGQVAFWRRWAASTAYDLAAFDAEFGAPPKPKTPREIWDETWAALPVGGTFHFSDHPERTHIKTSDTEYLHDGGCRTAPIDLMYSGAGYYTIVPKQ